MNNMVIKIIASFIAIAIYVLYCYYNDVNEGKIYANICISDNYIDIYPIT